MNTEIEEKCGQENIALNQTHALLWEITNSSTAEHNQKKIVKKMSIGISPQQPSHTYTVFTD